MPLCCRKLITHFGPPSWHDVRALSGKKEGGVENAAAISGESANVLRDACDLLFLDCSRVLTELTIKVTYAGESR